MQRIASWLLVCLFATLLPSATVLALAAPQQLLPICCRTHGVHACSMGVLLSTAPADAAPTLRQPACPYGQSLRAITTVTISADFTARVPFALPGTTADRQWIADAVAAQVLRRSAPRGPPSSFSA